jgi:hypothetical protein
LQKNSFSASDGEKVAKPDEVNDETHEWTRIKLAAKERMERKTSSPSPRWGEGWG